MNLIDIQDMSGRELDMSELGLTGLKLEIPSPSYETVTQTVDGRSGVIVVERILKERNLTARFFTKSKNYEDSLHLRDRIYGMLGNGEAIYVSENKNPLRRWKVYLEEWTPDRVDVQIHIFEIPLLAESGTSESVNVIRKSYSTPAFSFNNDGTLKIDPRLHQETTISFKGLSTDLIIRNKTTGDQWSWKGETVEGDVITLEGVRSLKNGVSIYKHTNKQLITFGIGRNDFEIVGATGNFIVTISTRLYFL